MSFVCPNCGSDVITTASSCPECGSDERTGWSENTLYDGLDLPDEEFEEDSSNFNSSSRRNEFVLMAIGLILIVIFVCRFVLDY